MKYLINLIIPTWCVLYGTYAETITDDASVTDQYRLIEYIQELTGKIEVLTKTVELLESRIQQLETQLYHTASSVDENASDTSSKIISKQSSSPVKKQPPQHMWNDILSLLQQKKYIEAEKKLLDYLKFYENGDHTADAYYWLGELKLLHNDYQKAQTYYAAAYKEILPKDSRKADCCLKIAECYFVLKKHKEACLFLKEIMALEQKGCPVSTATLQLMRKYWLNYKCA